MIHVKHVRVSYDLMRKSVEERMQEELREIENNNDKLSIISAMIVPQRNCYDIFVICREN